MARMHARKRGKSGSKKPAVKTTPDWVKISKKDLEKTIIELTKKGKSPSMIGLILRDQHGIPSVKAVLGKGVTQIVKENKLEGKLPEDMLNLVKRAVNLRKHLEKHSKDTHNKTGLHFIESKIRRLQKYYKKRKVLPNNWYYKPGESALLIK